MRERTWSQIVWDKAANRLARRVYTIQDPLGAEDFDLFWDGDAASRAADGPVTGTGTLVWREQGSPAYSQQHRVAVYSGSFRDGRAHGTGRFTHRSGLTYSGEWENGLMHGEGRIYFPNGDQYAGGFSAGLPQGEGIYIDTAGTIYDGGFASGVRSGSGSLYPANGAPFSAQWDDGQALSGSVRLLDPQEQRYPPVVWAQYARHDDIQVGVLVDRAYYAHVPGPGKPPIPYAADNRRDRIDIYPDDKRVIGAWRGTAPISMTEDEEFDFESSELGWKNGREVPFAPGFLSTANRIRPVPVIVEMRNDSRQPLRIVNAFLDVSESRSEPEPAVQLRMGYLGDCGNRTDFKADFQLENYGWSDATNAVLKFSFANDPHRQFSRRIGSIAPAATVDLSDELRQIGYPVDKFKAGPVICNGDTFEACEKTIREQTDFGPLAEHVTLNAGHMRTPVKGVLEYEWQDAAGVTHTKSSPFSVDLVVARMDFAAECGEGGSPEDRQLKPFDLAIDKKGYRIMVPLRDDIPPGVTGRWRIRLQAPRSSSHDFHIVFELADGRQIASRPVDMLYFKPKIPTAN